MNRSGRRQLGERGPKHPVVEIAYLTDGRPSDAFMASVIRCRDYEAIRTQQLIGVRSRKARSGAIASGRNDLTAAFVDGTSDYLWMLDDDMGFARTALQLLLLGADPTERPIMAGLCFAHRVEGYDDETNAEIFGIIPTLSLWEQHDGQVVRFITVTDYPRDAVVKIDTTGAACVLIHRTVLEKMRGEFGPNWWTQTAQPGGGTFSEDTSFYLRAHQLDIPVYANTGVRTSHDKGGIYLTEQAWDAQQAARAVRELASA